MQITTRVSYIYSPASISSCLFPPLQYLHTAHLRVLYCIREPLQTSCVPANSQPLTFAENTIYTRSWCESSSNPQPDIPNPVTSDNLHWKSQSVSPPFCKSPQKCKSQLLLPGFLEKKKSHLSFRALLKFWQRPRDIALVSQSRPCPDKRDVSKTMQVTGFLTVSKHLGRKSPITNFIQQLLPLTLLRLTCSYIRRTSVHCFDCAEQLLLSVSGPFTFFTARCVGVAAPDRVNTTAPSASYSVWKTLCQFLKVLH